MNHFLSRKDVSDFKQLTQKALDFKANPLSQSQLGKQKTLGLIFMNSSLRTRLSTQKAAINLGMQVIVLNINQDSWKLELNDGSVMNSDKVEHIQDAAKMLGLYCDIIGFRCFAELKSREDDYSEKLLSQLKTHCSCPIISLESATLHPLQSFADLLTIREQKIQKPKVVLTWAPHVKRLPQAVPNSFLEWMKEADVDLHLCHPKGYELDEQFTHGITISNKQEDSLKNADFVYAKNWSSFSNYGQMPHVEEDWMLNEQKMSLTNNAKFMHCLPVRRNVEVPDEILDGKNSLILQQAENRIYAAQAVLYQLLTDNF